MPFCPNCGSQVEHSWSACAGCGAQLGQQITPPQYSQPTSQNSQPTPQYSQPTPQYSQPGYQGYKTGNYGIPALILGIIGLVLVVLAPLALIFGIVGSIKDEKKAKSVIGIVFGSIGTFILFFFIL